MICSWTRFRLALPCLMAVSLAACDEDLARVEADTSFAIPEWHVDREIDPILDSWNIVALLGESERALFSPSKTLVVRCRELELEAYVVWTKRIGPEDDEGLFSVVTVRLDWAKPNVEIWNNSTDGKATFAPDAEIFVRSMMGHERLAVRVEPDGEISQTAVFDIREARPVVEEVLSACGL